MPLSRRTIICTPGEYFRGAFEQIPTVVGTSYDLTVFPDFTHDPFVMEKLVLASGSPRRRELLGTLGIALAVVPPNVDESIHDDHPPRDRVISLALLKARTIANSLSGAAPRLVLGADTLVCVQDPESPGEEIVLGKPADREAARAMLDLLSGRVHAVHTGLALIDRISKREWTCRSDSFVTFVPMSEGEIETFLDSGEWDGVAGGYRIQGMAACFIDKIEGSWSGIVGLPIRELYVMLESADFRLGL